MSKHAVIVLAVGASLVVAGCGSHAGSADMAQGASLTLVVQVVNDNGGAATPAEFTVDAAGPTPLSGAGGATSAGSFQPGAYTLTASTLASYASQGWTCVGATLATGDVVTVDAGAAVTCTIVEDDVAASLALVQHVTNDNGGTAQPTDVTLTATGPSTLTGVGAIASGADFQPGTYTLSATALTGYTSGAWTCTGATLGAGDTITLQPGDVATCSLTDDDVAPTLTLDDQVFNDNGGGAVAADFTVSASGPTPISGAGPVTSDASFAAGLYTLDATGPNGYAAAAWSCTGGSLVGSMLTIAVGDTVACSAIVDDDFVMPAEPTRTAVTTASGVQQQPSVAVDPANANHVAIAYMDYTLVNTGYAGIGVAVSSDGGAHFTTSSLSLPAGFDSAAGAPVARFYQGSLYVAFMAATFLGTKPGLIYDPRTSIRAHGMQSNNGIFFAGSSDGTTWSSPITIAANSYSGTNVPFDTMPDLAIDAATGAMYVTWARFYPAGQYPNEPTSTGGSAIMVARSNNGGSSWTTLISGGASVITDAIVPDAGKPPAGQGAGYYADARVAVGPESDVYVSASVAGIPTLFHSTDGGSTFSSPSTDANDPSGRPLGLSLPGTATTSWFNPTSTLTNDLFRTLPMRAIAADPTRPGYVYFVDSAQTDDQSNNVIDAGNVTFARSTDYGATWTMLVTLGGQAPQLGELPMADQAYFRSPLNDDDGNRFLAFDTTLDDDVISGQALPELTVDAQGNVMVIWYDTRRDPANASLDVFATISTDGGQSFSANSRLTHLSFAPSAGSFSDATGTTTEYLGDRIGLGIVGGTVYASWTDTQSGSQDIAMDRLTLTTLPSAANDRYEPNETAATATPLGTVTGTVALPRLVMVGGESDWFGVTAGATGTLTITATAATGGASLELDLWDAAGTTMVAAGQAITNGQQVTFNATSAQSYLVRVRKQPSAQSVSYTLTVTD